MNNNDHTNLASLKIIEHQMDAIQESNLSCNKSSVVTLLVLVFDLKGDMSQKYKTDQEDYDLKTFNS
jgi:hypothetical protein